MFQKPKDQHSIRRDGTDHLCVLVFFGVKFFPALPLSLKPPPPPMPAATQYLVTVFAQAVRTGVVSVRCLTETQPLYYIFCFSSIRGICFCAVMRGPEVLKLGASDNRDMPDIFHHMRWHVGLNIASWSTPFAKISNSHFWSNQRVDNTQRHTNKKKSTNRVRQALTVDVQLPLRGRVCVLVLLLERPRRHHLICATLLLLATETTLVLRRTSLATLVRTLHPRFFNVSLFISCAAF